MLRDDRFAALRQSFDKRGLKTYFPTGKKVTTGILLALFAFCYSEYAWIIVLSLALVQIYNWIMWRIKWRNNWKFFIRFLEE